ncbi:MAG: hypothetical protein M3R60_04220 [Pseudomonadota bacterium]|nr:hypothetical protein [Pseudomonadota bacterium]
MVYQHHAIRRRLIRQDRAVDRAILIAGSCADVMRRGFERVFARVWHSNEPSLRAFAGAKWTRCATVIEVNPFRRARPLRFRVSR